MHGEVAENESTYYNLSGSGVLKTALDDSLTYITKGFNDLSGDRRSEYLKALAAHKSVLQLHMPYMGPEAFEAVYCCFTPDDILLDTVGGVGLSQCFPPELDHEQRVVVRLLRVEHLSPMIGESLVTHCSTDPFTDFPEILPLVEYLQTS
jgi:hypothetical protein